jgi:hypothetical protein
MRCKIAAVCVVSVAGAAWAQPAVEVNGARMFYQVFDTASNAWTTSISVLPGTRVEWRAVVSYTGTNTDVSALGSMLYQPTLSNADNDDTVGPRDEFRPWRSHNFLTGASAILTAEEGETGLPLASYGKVRFGPPGATLFTPNLAVYRHDDGLSGAPAGSWIRVAQTSGGIWPQASLTALEATGINLNSIGGGVTLSQHGAVLTSGQANSNHITGTQHLVIFRCAVLLSDLQAARTITLATAPGSLHRMGAAFSADDRRYISWQIGPTDGGSWRTEVMLESASINVIPGPGALVAGLAVSVMVASRRRQNVLGSSS